MTALPIPGRDALLQEMVDFLCRKYGIAPAQLLLAMGIAQDSDALLTWVSAMYREIPATVLRADDRLGPLEAIVKFLREVHALRPAQIARLLDRDPRVISVTYRRAVAKAPDSLRPQQSQYMIPLHLLRDDRLSVLEHIVVHLRTAYRLPFVEIARIIGRDPRTVGTVWMRAQRRLLGKEAP